VTVFFFVFYNDEEGVLLCGGDFFASSEPTIRCPSVQRPFSMQWPFSIFIINVFFLICFQKISQTNAKGNWTPFLAFPCPNTVSTPSQHRINTVPTPYQHRPKSYHSWTWHILSVSISFPAARHRPSVYPPVCPWVSPPPLWRGNHKKTKKSCGEEKNAYICIVKYNVEKYPFRVHVFGTEMIGF
jgi:hypothetical protein